MIHVVDFYTLQILNINRKLGFLNITNKNFMSHNPLVCFRHPHAPVVLFCFLRAHEPNQRGFCS